MLILIILNKETRSYSRRAWEIHNQDFTDKTNIGKARGRDQNMLLNN